LGDPRQASSGDLHYSPGGSACPGAALGAILSDGGTFVSIIRVGLAETKHFAEGYEAIFGKKKDKKEEKDESGAKAETGKKKKASKKKK
jgi:uncharacterized protein (UPF0264 family)